MTAIYDTTGANGEVKSIVSLFTNDPKAERIELTIVGRVKKPYVHHPHRIDFGESRAEGFGRKTIVIRELTGREMEVTDVETSKPWLRAHFLAARDERKLREELSTGDWQIVVSVAEDAPIGPIREEVVVSLLLRSSKPVRNIRIPVKGFVQGDLVYKPKTIFWGSVKQGETLIAEIMIEANGDGRVDILDVESKKGLMEIDSVDVARASARILVELKKNLDMDLVSDSVIITTSSEEMPQIKVPVYARISGEQL